MLKYIKPITSSTGSSGGDTTIITVEASVGFIFITNIESIGGNVSDKIYQPDTVPANAVLDECTSDTNNIRVHFIAEGGIDQNPIINIGSNVCDNLTQLVANTRIFSGYIDVTLNSSGTILVESNTDNYDTCIVNLESPPSIQSIEFINGYPGTQTELKSGDTFDVRIITDKPINRIEVSNVGACIAQNFTVSEGTDHTITVTIANRGTIATLQSIVAKVRTASGSYSDTRDSNIGGENIDGTTVVKLNNIYPSISFGIKTYPVNQEALKDTESATVVNTISNYNTVLYSSPNGDLNISNTITYESPKTVTRQAGNYNVSTNNLRIVATRNANAASTTVNTVVFIAHTAPTISVSEQYSRLRSSSTGSNYTITLTSNQKLIEIPTLTIPHGTQFNNFSTSNDSTQIRTITINDSDLKGTHNYNSISTKNLAGKIVTVISGDNEYIIGGFITRRIIFPSFNRLQPIGTNVTNTTKLQAVDVGGNIMNYQADKTNNSLTYTITNSSGNLDPTGDYIYVCDDNQVNQNSTGTAQIEIQEVI